MVIKLHYQRFFEPDSLFPHWDLSKNPITDDLRFLVNSGKIAWGSAALKLPLQFKPASPLRLVPQPPPLRPMPLHPLAATLLALMGAYEVYSNWRDSKTPTIDKPPEGKSVARWIDDMEKFGLIAAEITTLQQQIRLMDEWGLGVWNYESKERLEQLFAQVQTIAHDAGAPFTSGALKMVASVGGDDAIGGSIPSDIAARLKSDDVLDQWQAWRELYGRYPIAAQQITEANMGPGWHIEHGLNGVVRFAMSGRFNREDTALNGVTDFLADNYDNYQPSIIDLRTAHPSHSLAEFSPHELFWTNRGYVRINKHSYRNDYLLRFKKLLVQYGRSNPQQVLEAYVRETVRPNSPYQNIYVRQYPSGKRIIIDGMHRTAALVQGVREEGLDPNVWLQVPVQLWIVPDHVPIPEHLIFRFTAPAHVLSINELLPPPTPLVETPTPIDWEALATTHDSDIFFQAASRRFAVMRAEILAHLDAIDRGSENCEDVLRWLEINIFPELQRIYELFDTSMVMGDKSRMAQRYHNFAHSIMDIDRSGPFFLKRKQPEGLRALLTPSLVNYNLLKEFLIAKFGSTLFITLIIPDNIHIPNAEHEALLTAVVENLARNAANNPRPGKSLTYTTLTINPDQIVFKDEGAGMTPETLAAVRNRQRISEGRLIATDDTSTLRGRGWEFVWNVCDTLGIKPVIGSTLGKGTTVTLKLPEGFITQ